jgi:uncharacterized protein YegP (UPF0339 family)
MAGHTHVEKYQDENGEWRWRLRAINGEIVASGEGYEDESSMDEIIAEVFPALPVEVIAKEDDN